MPPKGAATRIKPLHLQTIQKLRVKSPNTHQANPCLAVMTSVLSPFPPSSLLAAVGPEWIALSALILGSWWSGVPRLKRTSEKGFNWVSLAPRDWVLCWLYVV
ncbi:hypothetical protein GX51_06260 [Blastomyces parvus]|uniref:Uncharacterized protein n=1 Tax=Blastomyces parvus TaxID=2060905 RepID=A0A2B7WST0_9EURO|nr:hypothetical protein GX51_06260 [Blastomyces parvus]